MLKTIKRHFTRICLALLAALGLSSCLEMNQEYILNPDGSGKLKITQAMAMPDLGGLGGEKADGDKKDNPMARKMLVSLLKADGIDAWTEVKYEVGKDGKTRAQATGYFADVTKVRVGGMDDKGKQSSGIFKDSDGNWVLDMKESLAQAQAKQAETTAEKEPAPTLTDEEVTAQIEEQRQQFAMQKAMIQGMLGTMKITTTISGGTIIEAKGAFEKKGESSASFSLTGEKMIEGMSKMLEDDAMMKKMIKGGKNPLKDADPAQMLSAFGMSEESKVVMKPTMAAFDYQAEVTAAKKNVSPELKKLLEEAKEEDAMSEESPAEKKEE